MEQLKSPEDILKEAQDEAFKDQNYTSELIILDAIERAQKNAIEAMCDMSMNKVFHKVCEGQIEECRCELLNQIKDK